MKNRLTDINQKVIFRLRDLILIAIAFLILMALLLRATYKQGVIDGRVQATQAINTMLEKERALVDER